MTQHIFGGLLQNVESRITPTHDSTQFFLDKNEQPDDVDFLLKNKVLNSLMETDWNRYPAASHAELEALVANYCQLGPENIVLSPGSASLITTLLNYFALNGKRIVIAQPTYTLFDYHCKTFNIPYEPWLLTPELAYDYEHLPALGAGSVLIITTPNNPVGNTFEKQKLEQILRDNPETCIIVDAVYAEFSDTELCSLVKKYNNLLVLRSFSKAFPIAGLRLGYLCAAPQTAALVKKLMLPFSINHFTMVFAQTVLFKPEFMESSKKRVAAIIREREMTYHALKTQFDERSLKVFKSKGNFLLIRIGNDAAFQKLLSDLESAGIKVLNTSTFPLLKNTLRVSIGTPAENKVFLRCLTESLEIKLRFALPQIQASGGYYQLERMRNAVRVATS